MFNFFKKKNPEPKHIYWRDASGQIACTKSDCDGCDKNCPIFLNTVALSILKLQEYQKVIPLYEEIIRIAPDFYEAWNNMGSAYGHMRNYAKSREMFTKAHELKPEKIAPVFGLALTNKDLGCYEKSLEWCDLYDEMSFDGRVDSVREYNLSQINK